MFDLTLSPNFPFNDPFNDWGPTDLLGRLTSTRHDTDASHLTETVAEDGTRSFALDVPGFKKTDLSVEVIGNTFTVSGKKGNRIVTLSRSLHAHYVFDSIKASLEDGVLTISYQTQKSKKIEISG